MASISAQLNAIKLSILGDSEQPLKRPFTRPSLLFDPKEAADIDLDAVLSIALQGLELLISFDDRFRNYKNSLFSHTSKEMDRELMGVDENSRINATISSYLRLVSVYFQHPSAIKTLEYLIRRYKIHVYNFEDLILCSLPYHETHVFVRIVQLIDAGNTKWKFLNGVKLSGAPPPRSVIVEQCHRDKGVLEALCNYASPTKKLHPSRPMITFCTAVIIEALGSARSVDNDDVTRILPFVNSGLHPDAKSGSDHKAGALMIVGLLASKVTLSPKLVKTLIRLVAEIAQDDAKESIDLQWIRLSLLTMINLIQLQSVQTFPRKALEILIEIRDFSGLLSELFKEFKIEKFFSLVLESVVDYSFNEELFQNVLISVLEVTPIKDHVPHIVTKVLGYCMKTSQKDNRASPSISGQWVKRLLSALNKKYPSELQGAIHNFLEEKSLQAEKGNPVYEVLGNVFDGNYNTAQVSVSNSKLWFALHHPKAAVRRSVLAGLNTTGILEAKATDPQGFSSVQDAILRQLRDDDLTIVEAAISLDGLTDIIDSFDLFEALTIVLRRCIDSLYSRSTEYTNIACDVAISCLGIMALLSRDHEDWLNLLGTMICPLLLILPKTQKLNLVALELAKKLNWPLYDKLPSVPSSKLMLQPESICSINLDTVSCLAEKFLMHPETYIASIAESCRGFESLKTLLYLVLVQSFLMKIESSQFFALLDASYPILKSEWETLENLNDVSLKELNSDNLKKWDCREFLGLLSGYKLKALNANILVCTFWRVLEALELLVVPAEGLLGDNKKWLEDLFVFFSVSHFNHVFKEHRLYLVTMSKTSPVQFLRRFFTEQDIPVAVQVESLHCFLDRCSLSEARLQIQFLAEFPSILVPLASDNQDVRTAAMTCIEGLRALWARIDGSSKKNGNQAIWSQFIDKILDSIAQQKRLILSDAKILPSLMVSLLGSSCNSLLVPKSMDHRFDQPTREKVLTFILVSAIKLPDYAKLMILSLLKGVGNAIVGLKELESFLSQLLTRRDQYIYKLGTPSQKLSDIEVEILCILLESCATPSQEDVNRFGEYLLKALKSDGVAMEDPAFVRPCVSVLHKLNDQIYGSFKTGMKKQLFQEVVTLFRSNNGYIQNAAREALVRLNISCSTIVQTLDDVFNISRHAIASELVKKKRKLTEPKMSELQQDGFYNGENTLSLLSSLLDILLLKKDIANRDSLMGPLFELVEKSFSDDWTSSVLDKKLVQLSDDVSQSIVATVSDIKQRLLILLEEISISLVNSPLKEDVVNEINVKVLVECARSAKDGVTRNHVFSLISSLAKITPEKVLVHVEDIFTVIGESAITQDDRRSQHVLEDLISTIVPFWLQRTKNMNTLLQIFMNVLPEIAEHRRLSIVVYLIRTLGESDSLASLLVLLFRSLVSRIGSSYIDSMDSAKREWEYVFAEQICEQYSCLTWLPSLVMLLRQVGDDAICPEIFSEMMFIFQFTQNRLQDPEFILKLESEQYSESIQSLLEDLMEQIGFLLQLVEKRRKKIPASIKIILKDCMRAVFKTVTALMAPSTCFKGIITLLRHVEKDVGKKALGLLCELVKEEDVVKPRRKMRTSLNNQWKNMDGKSLEFFSELCIEIVKIIDNSDDVSDSLKLAAVSAVEVLANRFPSDKSIYSECLASVTKYIKSESVAISSSCLRATGALVNVLGPRALPDLPRIMENVINISREVLLSSDSQAVKCTDHTPPGSTSKESIGLAVLVVLESVVDKLGGFLNPYLGDIITVLVLNSDYASDSDQKVKLKADTVRKLVAEKIPVRLTLPAMLKMFPNAVSSGDSSLNVYFGMLTNLIAVVDRPSVGTYHTKIFDLCLLALDLRRQRPVSIKYIDAVEKGVVATVIALTMKLTESLFRPLFIRSIEWAESVIEDGEHVGGANIDRAISFYGLVDKLAESHRSLFVPYFKYLLESCVRYLTSAADAKISGATKKKKAKISASGEYCLSLNNWQLRALVLSSLHKCFLYDTGSLKFLDSTNFQVLLKPIVSQIVVDPPSTLKGNPSLPSVNEVDDLVVTCLGQMAVTAGNDLLWKPLNHEVLMLTRSEKVRARILGLRVVKYLVENLREEFVFEAETIPFLAELFEDVEPSVKSLAQDVFKEMESATGKDLKEHLMR